MPGAKTRPLSPEQRNIADVVLTDFEPLRGPLCDRCRGRRALSLYIIHFWLALHGGPEINKYKGQVLISFHDMDYIGWDKIRSLYEEREENILAFIAEAGELNLDAVDASGKYWVH
jgi:hypothetical protein